MWARTVLPLAVLGLAGCLSANAGELLREVPIRQALDRRFPEEVVFVTYRDAGGPGLTVMGNNRFHGVIALKKGDPAHAAISESGEFVVAYPGSEMADAARHCFAHKGERIDDFEALGLGTAEATHVRAPLLTGCIANFEAKVLERADVGDVTVFRGNLVRAHHMPAESCRLFITGYDDGEPKLQTLAGAAGCPPPKWREEYPEQTVMIVTRGADGRLNAMTAGWTFVVPGETPLAVVAVMKTHFTHGLLAETKEFVYVYPGADMEREMLYCGTHSGRDEDKFKALGLQTQQARKVKPPLLTKALACFECKVAAELDYGSHTIYVGRIEAAHVSDKDVRRVYNLGRDEAGERVFGGLPQPE